MQRERLITYWLHGAEHFLKPNSRSAGQRLHRSLWNPKIHYYTHKSPKMDLTLSEMNLAHTHTPPL
jgi:hypothetical protein